MEQLELFGDKEFGLKPFTNSIVVRMQTERTIDNYFNCPVCTKKMVGFFTSGDIRAGKHYPVECRNCYYKGTMSISVDLKESR